MKKTNYPQKPALRSAVSKAARRLLPFLIVMYIVSFIDRVNIGYAKASFQVDTNISDMAFAFGAGVFFVGYAIFEFPSNLIMAKIGAKIWLSRIAISWGLVTSLMMFAHHEWSFYLIRALLGIAEAGFFPGVILYLSYWFPDYFRSRATGMFYFAIPVALAFGSMFSGVLLNIDGVMGLAGWQWMFLVQGALAVIIGIWAFFFLDNGPKEAKWLSAAERDALSEQLEIEESSKTGETEHGSIWKLLVDKVVLIYALVFFCIQISVYGVIFYLPTIVRAILPQDSGEIQVGLIGAIPWMLSIVGCYYIIVVADRSGKAQKRRNIVIISFVLMGISQVVSEFIHPLVGLCALTIAAATYMGATPVFWTIPSQYLSRKAMAGGIAVITALGNLGGFVSPNLKTWIEELSGVHALGMATMGVFGLLAAVVLIATRKHDALHTRTIPVVVQNNQGL